MSRRIWVSPKSDFLDDLRSDEAYVVRSDLELRELVRDDESEPPIRVQQFEPPLDEDDVRIELPEAACVAPATVFRACSTEASGSGYTAGCRRSRRTPRFHGSPRGQKHLRELDFPWTGSRSRGRRGLRRAFRRRTPRWVAEVAQPPRRPAPSPAPPPWWRLAARRSGRALLNSSSASLARAELKTDRRR